MNLYSKIKESKSILKDTEEIKDKREEILSKIKESLYLVILEPKHTGLPTDIYVCPVYKFPDCSEVYVDLTFGIGILRYSYTEHTLEVVYPDEHSDRDTAIMILVKEYFNIHKTIFNLYRTNLISNYEFQYLLFKDDCSSNAMERLDAFKASKIVH